MCFLSSTFVDTSNTSLKKQRLVLLNVNGQDFPPTPPKNVEGCRDILQATYPVLSGSWSVLMSRISSYLLHHQVKSFEHFQSPRFEKRNSEQSFSFWIYVSLVLVIAAEINENVQRFYGKDAILLQQLLEINWCISEEKKGLLQPSSKASKMSPVMWYFEEAANTWERVWTVF